MEINQAKPVPQTASTGSTGASAGAPGSEAGSDGFLSLMNCFMAEGGTEDIGVADAAPAAGQGTQGMSTFPDGMLSLIAPGLFSNLIIQPQRPAAGDAAAGEEIVADTAGEAALNPLNAPPPAPLQAPLAPHPDLPAPDLPAKGIAPQPGEGKPAADGGEMDQNAEAQISEEDLAKLVAEGKAKIEARQDGKAPQSSAHVDQPKTSAAAEQSTAAVKDTSVPVSAAVEIVREPASIKLTAGSPPDGNDRLAAASVSLDAQAAPTVDGDTDKVVAAGERSGGGDARAGSDNAGQGGAGQGGAGQGDAGQEGDDTHGGRQAQQHAARIDKAIDKANERSAEQQAEANASRASAQTAGTEAEGRGGAPLRMVSGATDEGGKPAAAKERGVEAGPTFEDALAKVKPTHREPEADGGLGVQAATRGPDETEATERTAAPHSRGAAPHSAADQVSVQLGKAVPGKNDQMVINLKPVELGSVEVRLDFGADGKVQASIMAERPETLEMLQKDQRALERALNDAGLQTDAGSLSFNLKGQGQGGNQRQFAGYNQPGSGRGKGFAGMDVEGPAIPDFAAPQYSASGANRSRLDIRI